MLKVGRYQPQKIQSSHLNELVIKLAQVSNFPDTWITDPIGMLHEMKKRELCRFLKRFYTYKKINNIFLKFNHFLLWMPKVAEIG